MVLNGIVMKDKKISEKSSEIKTFPVENPASYLPDPILSSFLSTEGLFCSHVTGCMQKYDMLSSGWPKLPAAGLPGHFSFQGEVERVAAEQKADRWAWEFPVPGLRTRQRGPFQLYSRMFPTWTYCLNCLSLGLLAQWYPTQFVIPK